MSAYRYHIKEIKEDKGDKVLGIIELGMWGDSDPMWIPKEVINDKMQIASWWLEKKGI